MTFSPIYFNAAEVKTLKKTSEKGSSFISKIFVGYCDTIQEMKKVTQKDLQSSFLDLHALPTLTLCSLFERKCRNPQ